MASDKPNSTGENGSEPYKVGPGKPPLHTRWEKGGPSPNPSGRPCKPKEWDLLRRMDPAAAAFLDYDRQSTGITDANGNEISNGLSVIKSLRTRAMKSERASEAYLRLKADAEERERAMRVKMGVEAMDHIMRYADMFIAAEAAGRPPPRVYPHPADIQFDEEGNVKIVGPVDALGHRQMMACVAERDQLIKAMLELYPNSTFTDKQVNEMWRSCSRRIYKLNRAIPPRLKQRIPPKPPRDELDATEGAVDRP